MKELWPGKRFTDMYERVLLCVVQLFLMVMILLGLFVMGYLLALRVPRVLTVVDSVEELQKAMLHGCAATLLILIGLELLETVRAYLADHYVRVEIVLIVAIIAMGRHIIMLDMHEMNGLSLIGIAAVMLAVTAGYFLVRRKTSLGEQGIRLLPQKQEVTPRSWMSAITAVHEERLATVRFVHFFQKSLR